MHSAASELWSNSCLSRSRFGIEIGRRVDHLANRLFESFTAETREHLRQGAHLVHLTRGQVLYEPGERVRFAYFPTSGMLSLLAITQAAETLEIAIVGATGFAGVPIILPPYTAPYEVMVQIPASAWRVPADVVAREFERSPAMRAALLGYIHGLLRELTQSAVCHRFHSLNQRLCRWLLVSRDCVQSDTIELTQEFIAHMLGSSRPKVSLALVALEDRQLIRQRHGRIDIKNPKALELTSCECYRALKAALRRPIGD